jgi:glucose/arabinose dehydrogenase
VYLGPYVPWQGSVFVTTLRGQRLWRVALDRSSGGPSTVAILEPLFEGKVGRIRAIAMGPDGFLYVASSNRDRRGRPGPDDDQIYRVRVGG